MTLTISDIAWILHYSPPVSQPWGAAFCNVPLNAMEPLVLLCRSSKYVISGRLPAVISREVNSHP